MTARTLPFEELELSTARTPGELECSRNMGGRRPAMAAISSVVVPARRVWTGNFHADSQERLEELSQYRFVMGNLVIEKKIDSLCCLCRLENVVGDLVIQSTRLSSLEGLEGLVRVDGDVSIGDNPRLKSLRGLGNVLVVGRSVFVWANDELVDLAGLRGIEAIPRHLEIWGNTGLRSLLGLESLVSVGGDLSIGTSDFGNESLGSLAALRHLRTVGGAVNICLNPGLVLLDGIEQLARVSKGIVIRGNDHLRHVRALCGLEYLGGDLVVEHNLRLEELEGLDALQFLGGELVSADNPSMEQPIGSLSVVLARRGTTKKFMERQSSGFVPLQTK